MTTRGDQKEPRRNGIWVMEWWCATSRRYVASSVVFSTRARAVKDAKEAIRDGVPARVRKYIPEQLAEALKVCKASD